VCPHSSTLKGRSAASREILVQPSPTARVAGNSSPASVTSRSSSKATVISSGLYGVGVTMNDDMTAAAAAEMPIQRAESGTPWYKQAAFYLSLFSLLVSALAVILSVRHTAQEDLSKRRTELLKSTKVAGYSNHA
jgi:hypothetical protein